MSTLIQRVSLRDFVDQIELNAPKSLDYDALCRWVESRDWLSMDWQSAVPPIEDPSDYARNILCLEPFEVVMLHWPPGVESAVHHHEGFWGSVVCLQGTLENVSYRLTGTELVKIVGHHLFNHSGIRLWHHIALHMR